MTQDQLNIPKPGLKYHNTDVSVLQQSIRDTAKIREYRGYFANLLVQALITATVNGTTIGQQCDQVALTNMIADKVSIQAAMKGVK